MEQSTQILMNQVMHLYVQRSLELVRDINIHPGQGGLLWVLKCNEGLSQKELADRLGVKPPSITAMIKKLEAEQYIMRRQDEKDQRITRIYLTSEGEEIAACMGKVLDKLSKEAFANMSEEEVLILRRLLRQMSDNLSKNK